MNARRLCRALSIALWVASGIACRDPMKPTPTGEAILVATSAPDLPVVGASERAVLDAIGEIPAFKGPFAVSRDSATVYLGASDERTPAHLLALDTKSRRILWRDYGISTESRRTVENGIEIYGVLAMTVSPDGRYLFVAYAYSGSAQAGAPTGIAVLDTESSNSGTGSRNRIAFVPDLWVEPGGLSTLPPGPVAANGAVLVAGHRGAEDRRRFDSLYVLDPATLRVKDSAAVETSDIGVRIWQTLPDPDGRHVYLQTPGRIIKYDLVAHRTVASVPRPANGALALARDGRTLYLSDAGDGRDSPGSGFIFVFDTGLVAQPPIDLRVSAAVQGQPPSTRVVATSAGGRWLYITSGSAEVGPLFSAQPARLLVVDARTGQLDASISLPGWSTTWLLVR